MKFYSFTLGCRTNQYDSAALESALREAGVEIVRIPDDADVIYVQTCSVTGRADTKSGQVIRKLSIANPKARLLVGGCGPQRNEAAFTSIDGVEKVFGVNSSKDVVAYLTESANAKNHKEPFGRINDFIGRKRAHVKIQDGCDSFCTYCIVPHLRGAPVSRPLEDVLEQLRVLIDKGFCEIVLTGIHVGKYLSNGISLSKLLEKAVTLDGDFRLRLSSIEPQEVDEPLLDLVVDHPKVCNHIHIPIQSGDEQILAMMGRKYRLKDVRKLFDVIRSRDKFCGIGTDVITGFPGETELLFKNTISFIENTPLTYGHVFPYSVRKGTVAATMPSHVERGVALKRAIELKELFEVKKEAFFRTMVGQSQGCIIETNRRGHSSNYAPVEVNGKLSDNSIVSLKFVTYDSGKLIGE
jgi:threonylcarbamoyladenosine tRNA methylthiotransferase MtaB